MNELLVGLRVKRIWLPSGDHVGPVANRPSSSSNTFVRPDPSGRTVQRAPLGWSRSVANRILVPSGDQRAHQPGVVPGVLRRWRFDPSTLTTQREPPMSI